MEQGSSTELSQNGKSGESDLAKPNGILISLDNPPHHISQSETPAGHQNSAIIKSELMTETRATGSRLEQLLTAGRSVRSGSSGEMGGTGGKSGNERSHVRAMDNQATEEMATGGDKDGSGAKNLNPKHDFEYMGAQIDKLLKMPSPPGNRWKSTDSERKLKCKLCQRSFSKEEDLRRHYQEHNDDKVEPKEKRDKKRLKGESTEVAFKKTAPEGQETVVKGSPRSWNCTSCGSTFPNKAALMRHEKTEHQKNSASSVDSQPNQVMKEADHTDADEDNTAPPQLSMEVTTPAAVQTAFSIISTDIVARGRNGSNDDSRRHRISDQQNAQSSSPVMNSSKPGSRGRKTNRTASDSSSKSGSKPKVASTPKKSPKEDTPPAPVPPPATPSSGRASLRRNIQKPKWLSDADLVTDYEVPRGTNAMRSGTVQHVTLTNGNQATSSTSESKKGVTVASKSEKNKRRVSNSRDSDQKKDEQDHVSKKPRDKSDSTEDIFGTQNQQAPLSTIQGFASISQQIIAEQSSSNSQQSRTRQSQVVPSPKPSNSVETSPQLTKTTSQEELNQGSTSKKLQTPPRSAEATKVSPKSVGAKTHSNKTPRGRQARKGSQEPSAAAATDTAANAVKPSPSETTGTSDASVNNKRPLLVSTEPHVKAKKARTKSRSLEKPRKKLKIDSTLNKGKLSSSKLKSAADESKPKTGVSIASVKICPAQLNPPSSNLPGNSNATGLSDTSESIKLFETALQSPLTGDLAEPSSINENSSHISQSSMEQDSVFFSTNNSFFDANCPSVKSLGSLSGISSSGPFSFTESNNSFADMSSGKASKANPSTSGSLGKGTDSIFDSGPFAEVEAVTFADISSKKVSLENVTEPKTRMSSVSSDENIMKEAPKSPERALVPVSAMSNDIQLPQNMEEMPILRAQTPSNSFASRVDSVAEEPLKSIDEEVSSSSNNSVVPHQAPILSVESGTGCMEDEIDDEVLQELSKAVHKPGSTGDTDSMHLDDFQLGPGRRDRSDSLSMRSCGSGSQSEKIKALDDTTANSNSYKMKVDQTSKDKGNKPVSECLDDSDSSDSNDSLMSEFSELAAQVSEKTDGVKLKEDCLRFIATKVSSKSMWIMRKELKKLKKDKDYFKFGKLTPLAAGLMHDIFCQSLG